MCKLSGCFVVFFLVNLSAEMFTKHADMLRLPGNLTAFCMYFYNQTCFSQKIGSICMKYQSLLSGKNKKSISKRCVLKLLRSMLSA